MSPVATFQTQQKLQPSVPSLAREPELFVSCPILPCVSDAGCIPGSVCDAFYLREVSELLTALFCTCCDVSLCGFI